MGIVVKHTFVSPKLDGPDPTVVRPSNWNDEHEITGDGWLLAGMVLDWIGHTLPSYLLECFGQSVSAASYPKLFAALVRQGTVTLTLGSPGVVNWVGHGLVVGSKVRFRTTGALPTGLVANTDYFVISAGFTTAAFRVSATLGGGAIDFTGSQSGVHTAVNAQYGASTDLTSFTVPDLRGRVTAGLDTMGGTSANRLTGLAGGVDGDIVGAAGGVESHTLTLAQIAAHQHNNNPPNPTVSLTGIAVTVDAVAAHTHTVTGTVDSSGAHTHTVTGNISAIPDHTHVLTGANVAALDHTHSGSGGTIGNAGAHTHSVTGTVAGTALAGGAHTHTISGTIDTGGSHSHTVTGNVDAGGAHSHAITSLVISTHSGHTHPDTFAATFAGNSHAHGMGSMEVWNAASGSGGHNVIQPASETGGVGPAPATDFVNVGGSVSISGSVSSGGSHTHTLTSGGTDTEAAHTHVFSSGVTNVTGGHTHGMTGVLAASGGSHTHTLDLTFSSGTAASAGDHTHSLSGLTIAPAGAHNHTWSGTAAAAGAATPTFSAGAAASAGAHVHTFSAGAAAAAGAHTHTASATGTATSAQADYLSDVAGGDGAHNNVQPTFVLRKVLYVG